MNTNDFTLDLLVDQSPREVYNAINNVSTWWSEDFKGSSGKLNDVFEVRFKDVHYSQHKITELVPGKKIVWLVTDSRLNFLKDKTEWNGTENIFDISEKNGKTLVHFTHKGLVPSIECFGDCSKGWTHFLNESLLPFITTGKANPNVLEKEIKEKSGK